jgi:hypothetical protein
VAKRRATKMTGFRRHETAKHHPPIPPIPPHDGTDDTDDTDET